MPVDKAVSIEEVMSIETILVFHLFLVSFASFVEPFSWKSCGNKTDLIKIENLVVNQNETMVVNVKAQGSLGDDLASPITGNLKISKKLFWGWTEIPCIDGMGSCTFTDVCTLSPYTDVCPPEIVGLPCKCPITKGPYGGTLLINLRQKGVPNWLEQGSFRIQAELYSAASRLICLQFEIKIK